MIGERSLQGLLELLAIPVDRLGIHSTTGSEDLVLVFVVHFLDGFFVRNPLNAVFRGLEVQLQRTLNRDAPVTEGFNGKNFTLLGFLKVPIHPHDLVLVGLADKLAFTAEGLTHFGDRKSTRLNSSHVRISYAVFCLKKKTTNNY